MLHFALQIFVAVQKNRRLHWLYLAMVPESTVCNSTIMQFIQSN